MTDPRQFCSRHAAHFWPGAGVWHRKQLDQYFAEVGRVIKKSELTEFGWLPILHRLSEKSPSGGFF
jgi:hypothetical protein